MGSTEMMLELAIHKSKITIDNYRPTDSRNNPDCKEKSTREGVVVGMLHNM